MDKNLKLLCSDIDGTLLNADRDIDVETIAAVSKLSREFPIILASSRMPSAMYYLQEKLGRLNSPLICYNGGLVLDSNGMCLQSHTVSLDFLATVIEHQKKYAYNISTYCTDTWRTESEDYWTIREIRSTRVEPVLVPLEDHIAILKAIDEQPHKIMCMGTPEALDDLIAILEKKHGNEAHFYRSKDTYLEISAKNIDKSTALEQLIKDHYNLNMENVIAFGDNFNDVTMIKNVGLGVAVANATQEVKDVADYISEFTNKEHAVARAIEQFLL
ncbi:Cof-type HAD-IIB family hydrolase [Leeuwenhoekiella sp. MAR_2009_132]|uniref:Cof-type HAD-IIB family hydrolase n=1 Tax=Leeuwenhoekiella sp. MAR_2009_132 TaxID=1392489 RepID=UPI00048C08CE|nr:Cof-type HAD-IIB family hydrolase [Leeuwenhoekiella sp. MAR_2009_132]